MGQRRNQIRESDIFSHLTSAGYMPRWIVLSIDIVITVLAFYLAYFVSFPLYYDGASISLMISRESSLLVVVAVQIVCFWAFHTYSGILRYSSFVDIVKIVLAVAIAFFWLLIANRVCLVVTHDQAGLFLRVTLLCYAAAEFIMLMMLRLMVKTAYDFLISHSVQMKAVAVYGTKAAGVSIAKMIRTSDNLKFRLVAFIDDEPRVANKQIFGVPVVSTLQKDKMFHFFERHKINTVIVSPFKMKELNPERDLDAFIERGIEILTVPSMNEWHEGDEPSKNVKNKFKNIQIEDLLNRLPIKIEKDHVQKQVAGKVVMITGAAGSIGSEIVRQLTRFNPKMLVLYDNAETPLHNIKLELDEMKPSCMYAICIGDMRNRQRLESVITTYHPNIIYHAAAYKHVPMMEDAPSECVLSNIVGTRNIANLAVENGVESFVMVSTDKAVNPTNVMGASKRIAEIYVQSLFKKNLQENPNTTKFITTRFGNVLGSNGSVIPLFKKQIEKGGPVTVTHPDIIRYFMTIPEACQLVLEAGAMGQGGEIFIFDMGQPVKIADLARKMIRLAGYKPEIDIPIVYTGLRPGEKLFEELLNVKEKTQPTYNEKIMIAKVREYDFDAVAKEIDKLVDFAYLYKSYLVVSQMKKIVPEYISKNSQFEQLDIEAGK